MYNEDANGNELIMDQLEFPVEMWKIGAPIDKKKIDIKYKNKKAGTLIFKVQAFPFKVPREILKFLLVGEIDVGKSQLLSRFTKNEYTEFSFSQIGTYFEVKDIDIDGKNVTLQIWDSPGTRINAYLVAPFYRNVSAFMLVFSVIKRESFESIINFWYEDIKKYIKINEVVFVLVGNMIDRQNERVDSY